MRISDWSSDVCSSDLVDHREMLFHRDPAQFVSKLLTKTGVQAAPRLIKKPHLRIHDQGTSQGHSLTLTTGQGVWISRSEERRVGKACVSTCRSRGSP